MESVKISDPEDFSTTADHVRAIEREFDASGDRLVRIAKEAARLWWMEQGISVAPETGCASVSDRVSHMSGNDQS